MSTWRENFKKLFDRMRQPAALNYLSMWGIGLAGYFMIMTSRGNDLLVFMAIVLAIPGIIARWTFAPAFVLMLTTLMLIDPGMMGMASSMSGGSWYGASGQLGFGVEDILLALFLLAYVIGHFRLLGILHQALPNDPTLRKQVDPDNPPRRATNIIAPDEFTKTLMVLGGCAIAGALAWGLLYLIDKNQRPNAFTDIGWSRCFLFLWAIGSLLLFATAILAYLRHSRMTRLEAEMVLRDGFFHETRRETDRVQRWRRWYKRRTTVEKRK
jgi:hypothetical protein